MRTLDDIIPPSRKRAPEPVINQQSPQVPMRGEPLRYDRPPRFPYATLIAILLVIAASVGALFYFSSAKVEVTPNSVTAEVQGTLTATQSAGDLPFEIVSVEKIASQSVKGSGTKTVTASASGTITIYNTQAQDQKLVANTRFATLSGLIFRIKSAVTIPAGTTAKPGSVSTKVYADQAGSTYNVGSTNFTIPGFAGTPLATQVYAKSSGAMIGGASGTVPAVDPTLEAQTRTQIIAQLSKDMDAAIAAQIAQQLPGYVLIPGAATTTYTELTPEGSPTTGTVEVKVQGKVTAIVFPNTDLAKAIASKVSGFSYSGEPVTLTQVTDLSLAPQKGIPNPGDTSFIFALSGKAHLIYVVDPTRIQAAVSGQTRDSARSSLTNYPEVKRAIITLRPFWRKTFPQDPSAITVVVDNPE